MRAYQIGTIIILSLGMVTAFQNCGQTGMQAAKDPKTLDNPTEKSLQTMRSLLDSLNQEDLTCAQDSDCEAMAIGHAGCGGPSEYLVTSLNTPRRSELISLAALYEQNVKAFQATQTDVVWTCAMLMPPQVHCVSNICR